MAMEWNYDSWTVVLIVRRNVTLNIILYTIYSSLKCAYITNCNINRLLIETESPWHRELPRWINCGIVQIKVSTYWSGSPRQDCRVWRFSLSWCRAIAPETLQIQTELIRKCWQNVEQWFCPRIGISEPAVQIVTLIT